MRRHDLDELATQLKAERGDRGTAITIALPTHRHAPDNAQDPVRVKMLAQQARGVLDELDLSREQRSQLETQLDQLVEHVDTQVGFSHTDLGLACYLTPGSTVVVSLAHQPIERVIVSDEFSLAAPIADVTSTDDVEVLVLSTGGGSTDGARLYHLSQGELAAVETDVLPASWDVRDGDTRFGERRNDSPKRDARIGNFLRSVDEHLLELFGNPHDRQIVLVGIERLRSHYTEVASQVNRAAIVAEVDGNVDRSTDAQLRDKAGRAIDDARRRRAIDAVAELTEAPVERAAFGPDDVYSLAKAGRVAKLLVEEGASDEIRVDGVVIADRVARTLRAAYDTGADIVIVPAGELTERGGVAAIARW